MRFSFFEVEAFSFSSVNFGERMFRGRKAFSIVLNKMWRHFLGRKMF